MANARESARNPHIYCLEIVSAQGIESALKRIYNNVQNNCMAI